jgi:hypothetical protein
MKVRRILQVILMTYSVIDQPAFSIAAFAVQETAIHSILRDFVKSPSPRILNQCHLFAYPRVARASTDNKSPDLIRSSALRIPTFTATIWFTSLKCFLNPLLLGSLM